MGGWWSKKEQSVVNTGENVNNVHISNEVQIVNEEMIALLYIMTGLHLLEMAYCVYRNYQKRLKKKYQANTTIRA